MRLVPCVVRVRTLETESLSRDCLHPAGKCLWGENDCAADADCDKYNTQSLKLGAGSAGGQNDPKTMSCPMTDDDKPKWAHDACTCDDAEAASIAAQALQPEAAP